MPSLTDHRSTSAMSTSAAVQTEGAWPKTTVSDDLEFLKRVWNANSGR